MPRVRRAERRKHLIILLIALLVALAILLIQAETANAGYQLISTTGGPDQPFTQIGESEYERALTTERLLILGMLGLVVLTWLYLRWRPTPRVDRDPDRDQPSEHQ